MTEHTKAAHALIDVLHTLLQIIRACPQGIPAGELYAPMMGQLTANQFNQLVGLLVAAGRVTRSNHVLRALPPPPWPTC